MAIACGPFTQDSDLLFKPWTSLFRGLMSLKPGVVLLVSATCGVYARYVDAALRLGRS